MTAGRPATTSPPGPAARAARAAPAAALLLNAFVWGVSWWPFRQLEARGLHPLWATAVVYLVSSAVIAAWRPRAVAQLARTPALWLIFLASGTTNATFNWAVTAGDVVRVVLLFYLMPVWALLLARLVLHEPLTPRALLRAVAAVAGAAAVLSADGAAAGAGHPGAGGMPVHLSDVLALVGGFAFALNNVMLRRGAGIPDEGRALAMFSGGAAVAGGGALLLVLAGGGAGGVLPPGAPGAWAWPAAALALAFLASNLCLQYGAARLPAATTALIMPAEVLFAAVSAVAWDGARLAPGVLVGGALILGAALAALGDGENRPVPAGAASDKAGV